MIYKDKLQISRFVWPKVVKMSYRRNKFYIKLRPGEVGEWASDLRQSIVYTESCHQ
jgi:erythrocyte membrane protein band 4.1